jgi:aminopeptidase N
MAVCRLALALASFAVTAAPASAQRLPDVVVPDHYELRFAPDLQHQTLAGDETILVELVKPTTTITLNAVGITFGEVTVVAESGTRTATVTLDPLRQTATLAVRTPLPAGPVRIHISYSARLGTDLRGLYLGRANNRPYLASQFEATEARRAFPSMAETTGRPVDGILRTFMELPGVPLLSWQSRCQSNGATGITVTQARLVAAGAAGVVVDAAGTFCDDGLRADVQAFFTGKTDGPGAALARSMERIHACVRARATQAPNLERWLAALR